MMVMDFAKFTLIRWKGFDHYCDLGSGPIAISRMKNSRTISPFFSSYTTPENVEKHSFNPWLKDYSLDPRPLLLLTTRGEVGKDRARGSSILLEFERRWLANGTFSPQIA